MSHIIIDIELKTFDNLLFEQEKGKNFLRKWIKFNSHNLLKELDFHTFPPMKDYLKKHNLKLYNEISKENANILILSGYTGVGILSESHITIHTYPEEKRIALDLYSCKIINEHSNIEFIKNFINDIKLFKHYYIKR